MDTLSLIENGFKDLPHEDSTKNKALQNIEAWLAEHSLKAYVPYIEHLVSRGDFTTLLDSFWRVIPFGTGGRRGAVGAGPNRINPHTVTLSVQGHADYLKQIIGVGAEARVVVAYDVRGAWLFMPSIMFLHEPFRFNIQYSGVYGTFTNFGAFRDRDQISFMFTYLLN